MVLTPSPTIEIDLIPDAIRTPQRFHLPSFEMPPEGIPLRKVIEEMETMLISRSLEAAGGVQKRAAALLQVKPTTLNEMIKRYGIRPRRKRAGDAADKSRPARDTESGNPDESDSVAAGLIEKRFSSRG